MGGSVSARDINTYMHRCIRIKSTRKILVNASISATELLFTCFNACNCHNFTDRP